MSQIQMQLMVIFSFSYDICLCTIFVNSHTKNVIKDFLKSSKVLILANRKEVSVLAMTNNPKLALGGHSD